MIDRVLIIDDDEVTSILCEFIMERYEFVREVIMLKNGLEGIEYFEGFLEEAGQYGLEPAPALIFLDLNMPVMNGWDFLDEYCEKYQPILPNTKIVILSSTIDLEDLERAMEYEVVVDFLNKPLNDASISKLRANEKLQHLFNLEQKVFVVK
ncbi:response regulator [Adhaeribacter aquaticus]|uniref:response regulator n=1 Tax=Adhaeribacter aquaticus TaxID=299567 RepID=UPI0006853A4E|nr:response regulator [Adhaeribacter aquaticus]